MERVEHIVCMGEMRNENKIFVRKHEGRDHVEVLGIDGNIILA
jgi:hypothetical protein